MEPYLLLSFKDDYAEVLCTGSLEQIEKEFETYVIDWNDTGDALLMVKVVKSAEPLLDIKDWGDDEIRSPVEESQTTAAGC